MFAANNLEQNTLPKNLIFPFPLTAFAYPIVLNAPIIYNIQNFININIPKKNESYFLNNINPNYFYQIYNPLNLLLPIQYSQDIKEPKEKNQTLFANHSTIDSNDSTDTSKTKKKIFKVITTGDGVFNNVKYENNFDEKNFEIKKREKTKRKRFENADNIRKKIKCSFNKILFHKLNLILKNEGSKLFFERLTREFISNGNKTSNKKIINMTLKEILKKKEFYKSEISEKKYYHNIKVIESLENEKNKRIEKILNMKYRDLFNEYINSDDFNIDEINRLKSKNMSDSYIKRYIYFSNHFIDFFS